MRTAEFSMVWHPGVEQTKRLISHSCWQPATWLVVLALSLLAPPAFLISRAAESGDRFSNASRTPAGEVLTPNAAESRSHTFTRTKRSVSLLSDGILDVALTARAGRPLLFALRPGHWIDLGLRDGTSFGELAAEQLKQLPEAERASLSVAFVDGSAHPLRRAIPVTPGHLYLFGTMDVGDGREQVCTAIFVDDLDAEGKNAAFRSTFLSRQPCEPAAPRPPSDDPVGFARLYSLSTWGDPVKASYSFRSSWRDCAPTETSADLLFGARGTSLDVQIASDDRSSIARLHEGALAMVDEGAWSRRVDAEAGAHYALRVRDDASDELLLLTISEIDRNKGVMSFSWRRVMSIDEFEDPSFTTLMGRVTDAADRGVADATVWHTQRLAGDLGWPWDLRHATSGPDGSFVLTMPPSERRPSTLFVRRGDLSGHALDRFTDERFLAMTALPAGSLRVSVEKKRSDGGTLRLRGPGDIERTASLSESDPVVVFRGLTPAPYIVDARCGELRAQTEITVTDDPTQHHVELTLQPTGRIVAYLFDEETGAYLRENGDIFVDPVIGWKGVGRFSLGRIVLDGVALQEDVEIEIRVDGYEPKNVRMQANIAEPAEREIYLTPVQ